MSGFTQTKIVDTAGSGDYTRIKDALQYFVDNSRGGVVIVERGTYTISSTQDEINIPSSVALIGRGDVTIELNDNSMNVMKNRDATNGNDRIMISGFKVKGKSGATKHLLDFRKLTNSVIEKVCIDGVAVNTGTAGISLYDTCKGNRISQCTVKTCDYGISLSKGCENNTVAENEIFDHYTGIYVAYGEGPESIRNIIAHNVCHSAKTDAQGNGDDGILLERANRSVIQGNICVGNGEHGIYMSSSQYCTMIGNICHDNKFNGIQLNGSSGATTEANYNTVVGNTCYNNRGGSGTNNGIYVGYYAKRNTVNSNVCHKNEDYGIYEASAHGAERNVVVGNICHENGSGPPYGVQIYTEPPSTTSIIEHNQTA